jgi:beta-glucosidase
VHIKAGETAEVKFELARRDVSNWSTEKQDWVVTEYEKTVYVGSSSRELHLSAKLE